MKGMNYYRRILEEALGRKLKGPFWPVHHINGNRNYNVAENLWEFANPIHVEIDRGVLDEPKNGGRFPRPSDPDSKEDGFLNKEVIKDLCETFDDGEKNKNQSFELSDSYRRMGERVFGRLLRKKIINPKEYEAIKLKKGKIYKAGQQMNEKQPRELIEA
jgi:hypothetical protein